MWPRQYFKNRRINYYVFFKKNLLLLGVLPFLAVGSAKAVVTPLTQSEVSAVQNSRLKYGNDFERTFQKVNSCIQLSVSGLASAIRPEMPELFLGSDKDTNFATYILPFLPPTTRRLHLNGLFHYCHSGVYPTDRAILNYLTKYLYISNHHDHVNWTKGTKRALRKIFVVDGYISKLNLMSALEKMILLDANEVLGNSNTAVEYRGLLGKIRDPQRTVLGREVRS